MSRLKEGYKSDILFANTAQSVSVTSPKRLTASVLMRVVHMIHFTAHSPRLPFSLLLPREGRSHINVPVWKYCFNLF